MSQSNRVRSWERGRWYGDARDTAAVSRQAECYILVPVVRPMAFNDHHSTHANYGILATNCTGGS